MVGLLYASIGLFRSIYGSLLTLGAYHFSMGGVEPQMGDDEEYHTQVHTVGSTFQIFFFAGVCASTVTFLYGKCTRALKFVLGHKCTRVLKFVLGH